jgi:hypothetical protein
MIKKNNGVLMNQLDIAKKYAEVGIKVFPCNPTNKSPITKGGFKDATTDVATIESWWTKHPNSLIGSPNESFTVLDVDSHGLCSVGKMLTDDALKALEDEGITKSDTMKVKTLSGGIHYYFKHENISRSIKALPNIDILGNGGYTILPDQTNYVCETTDEPWNGLKSLKKLNTVKLSILTDKFEEITKTATLLKKASKGQVVATKKSTKQNDAASFGNKEREDLREGGYRVVMDYDKGTMRFVFSNAYGKNKPQERANEKEELLKDGKIVLKKGMLTQEMILAMFYNIEIQKKLGKHLGLKVPEVNQSCSQRSVLPGHTDRRPSMSVRWVDGDHIVARDHSNHFNDTNRQVDYDLIRLYTTMVYKTATPRFSTGERNMWFLKLMHEANLLDVSDLEFEYEMDGKSEELKPTESKVLEGYKLLYMLKSSYHEFDGTTAFSDRFTAGWCEVSPASSNSAKTSLIEKGFFAFVDTINCDTNNQDFNLRCTRGLKPIMVGDDYNSVLQQSLLNEKDFKEKRKKIIDASKKDAEPHKDFVFKATKEPLIVTRYKQRVEKENKLKNEKNERIKERIKLLFKDIKENPEKYLKSEDYIIEEFERKYEENLRKNKIEKISEYNLKELFENLKDKDIVLEIDEEFFDMFNVIDPPILVKERAIDKYYHEIQYPRGASP